MHSRRHPSPLAHHQRRWEPHADGPVRQEMVHVLKCTRPHAQQCACSYRARENHTHRYYRKYRLIEELTTRASGPKKWCAVGGVARRYRRRQCVPWASRVTLCGAERSSKRCRRGEEHAEDEQADGCDARGGGGRGRAGRGYCVRLGDGGGWGVNCAGGTGLRNLRESNGQCCWQHERQSSRKHARSGASQLMASIQAMIEGDR